jgi:hypothetical protein
MNFAQKTMDFAQCNTILDVPQRGWMRAIAPPAAIRGLVSGRF